MIQVYNSMTQKIEPLETLKPGQVLMYCCGPTVYGLLHVGNFRGAVFYNFLRSFLEYKGYRVTFVYNFTDVDDKIIARALAEKQEPQELAQHYIEEFWVDFHRLGLAPHSINPKVTESMGDIISFIQGLIDKGYAYRTEDGDVYFEIRRFSDYGKLSKRKTEDLQKGVRIEVKESKKESLDFALWKAAKDQEMSWPSPWGMGRPGWHIECSAMIHKHLGHEIDIHGGGLDLLFPHHENELTQSESFCGGNFVRYWVHHNMIQMNGSKMSKSLGNIISTREFLDRYHPEIYKHMVLSVHYRSILDLGQEAIASSIKMLAKVYSSLSLAEEVSLLLEDGRNSSQGRGQEGESFCQEMDRLRNQIVDAGSYDFNSALILTYLYEAVRLWNQKIKRVQKVTKEHGVMSSSLLGLFQEFGPMLSLFQEKPKDFLIFLDDLLLAEKKLHRQDIQNQVDERMQWRQNKNYEEADKLRKVLEEKGIALSDLPSGECYWEVAKS
jgi:cysteinyl-tRNA synthetase